MSGPDNTQYARVVQLRQEIESLLNHVIDASAILLEDVEQKPWANFIEELQYIQKAVHRFRTTIDKALQTANIDSGTIDVNAFDSDVYHDIRSPLNPIIGYSALVLYEADDIHGDIFKAVIKKIEGTGKQLLEAVKKIEYTIEGHHSEDA